MSHNRMLYFLPMIFAISELGYFLPFIIAFHPGTAKSIAMGLLLLIWVVCFASAWLFHLVLIFRSLYLKIFNKHYILSAMLSALIYIMWFILTSQGYLITV